MKYDGIVIFSDLDGTLLDDNRNLSRENFDAVAKFVSQGGKFGVATGRMEKTTLHNFPDLAINIPSIFFNGALVYDVNTKDELFSILMPKDLKPLMTDIIARYPEACCEINVRGRAYIFNINDIVRRQLEREGLEGVEAPWEDIPHDWLKVIFASENDILQNIKADLESFKRDDINIIFSEKEFLDIIAKNATKGAALKYLKEIYKQEWRFVVAIGDNDNDIEMIREADLGIAVKNARPDIKKAAKHTIKSNNHPCIPQVLEILEEYLPSLL